MAKMTASEPATPNVLGPAAAFLVLVADADGEVVLPEAVGEPDVVVAATPDLVTLNSPDSAKTPEFVVVVLRNWMVYWLPGVATRLLKAYLSSAVFTELAITEVLGGES